jgi:Putative restriction endonuclease
MKRVTAVLPGTLIDPRYPESDGRFMGETECHNDAMTEIHEVVEDHFADVPDVYVASNLVMYYEKGNPRARRDPDILVANGVKGKHKRLSYRVWEERKLPRVLFEVASRRTWRTDIGEKRELHARLGIREYFVFDLHSRFLDPPLQGFRSVNGKSIPIEWGSRGIFSKQPGLYLTTQDDRLRFIDPSTSKPLLTRREQLEWERMRAKLEHERADLEERRAANYAAEIERLKARLADLES